MIKHQVFGIKIDDLSTDELKNLLTLWLNDNQTRKIFTPNPEFLLLAKSNKNFAQLINQSDLSLADGVGLKFAIAVLTRNRLINRQTGVDTIILLAELCTQNNKRMLLLGGKNKVNKLASEVLSKRFQNLDIMTVDPGFIKGDASSISISENLISEINSLKPDVVAVAMSFGKQERLISEIASRGLSIKIVIGIGGALDMISGILPRAPKWMRENGFEWLWRLYLEPCRIGRILQAIVLFPIMVIWTKIKQEFRL